MEGFDALATDAFELIYEIRDQVVADRMTVESWYNQTRFNGNAKTIVLAHSLNDVEDLPAAPDTTGSTIVYHLLGKLSATPAYAVTQEDVVEFFHSLQSETRQPSLLFDELNRG